ncbi:unnamed protein product, partial [Rotaria sp. Silwood1]
KKEKWETFKSGSIPQNIIDWICTAQPVHRCRREIFESILLHGHVMSRDYMENLKKSECVINSILQHSQLRRIQCLREENYAKDIKEYVTALVLDEFERKHSQKNSDEIVERSASSFPDILNPQFRELFIKNKEGFFSHVLSENDIKTIKTKAIEIAQASIKLHSNPAGIGYERDKDLGTHKNVFSVLGPHTGDYGDVFIVFKREILHHPDSNFSIQSATSYVSGRAFKWRPWLGEDPGSKNDRIKLYHNTKLHAAITGYEYATALELIATFGRKIKSMNIDLDTILRDSVTRDSHMNIEAHLPQLIPLDYIDHIYLPKQIFDTFSTETRQAINTIFHNRISIKSFSLIDEYRSIVIKDIIEKYGQRDIHSISRPIQGTIITIPSSDLTDHYVLPITISQAYKQYKVDYSNVSSDDIPFYIYWQVMNGDMMLTLSNEQINTGKQQPNLRCLISYIAEKPSTKDFHYHENESYLYNGRPFQHEFVTSGAKNAAKSRCFYIGCNTDDFMTFCLEIQRSTGKVILSHAGPNSIYNHEQISSTFSKSDLDLNQLNFIHVSARARTIPIRNVLVTFEKQSDLHPAFDKTFDKDSSSTINTVLPNIKDDTNYNNVPSSNISDSPDKKSSGFLDKVKDTAVQAKDKVKGFFFNDNDSSLTPCPDSIYCLIQYSEEGSTHNSKYSHPCRFSELCRDQECHFTHEPHQVIQCSADRNCKDLCNPIHRAQYRHTGWPDFLIPCRDQQKCRNQLDQHRIKYSHGEPVLDFINRAGIQTPSSSIHSNQSLQQQDNDHHQKIPCKWGSKCRDILDSKHCSKYSHSNIVQQQNDNRIVCKWGNQCHDQSSAHRLKYSHP